MATECGLPMMCGQGSRPRAGGSGDDSSPWPASKRKRTLAYRRSGSLQADCMMKAKIGAPSLHPTSRRAVSVLTLPTDTLLMGALKSGGCLALRLLSVLSISEIVQTTTPRFARRAGCGIVRASCLVR